MLFEVTNIITCITCLITAFVIQRIYTNEKLRNNSTSVKGIKWFALAIFLWGIGAALNIVFTLLLKLNFNHKIIIGTGVIFSLLNSLCILMSIPSIEHEKDRSIVIKIIEKFNDKEVFIIFGGILVMIASVFLITLYTNPTQNTKHNVIWLIDIPISLLVAFALLKELNKAFFTRGMKFMLLPTFLLFFLIIIAVTHRIIPFQYIKEGIDLKLWNSIGTISSVSFKFLFIILFTILLYSWKLLTENEEQHLKFNQIKKQNIDFEKQIDNLSIANNSHLNTIKELTNQLKQKENQIKILEKDLKVNLSDRQKEVLGNLALLGTTKSYTEIADAMNISTDGFQTHIYQIKKALNISGANGKEQLINYAKNNNLIAFASINHD